MHLSYETLKSHDCGLLDPEIHFPLDGVLDGIDLLQDFRHGLDQTVAGDRRLLVLELGEQLGGGQGLSLKIPTHRLLGDAVVPKQNT